MGRCSQFHRHNDRARHLANLFRHLDLMQMCTYYFERNSEPVSHLDLSEREDVRENPSRLQRRTLVLKAYQVSSQLVEDRGTHCSQRPTSKYQLAFHCLFLIFDEDLICLLIHANTTAFDAMNKPSIQG